MYMNWHGWCNLSLDIFVVVNYCYGTYAILIKVWCHDLYKYQNV